MPWIALVPDISGVCKVLGTLEMTAKPTNPASTRIARLASSVPLISYLPENAGGPDGTRRSGEVIRCPR